MAVFQAFKRITYFYSILQQIFFVSIFWILKGQKVSFCTDFCFNRTA